MKCASPSLPWETCVLILSQVWPAAPDAWHKCVQREASLDRWAESTNASISTNSAAAQLVPGGRVATTIAALQVRRGRLLLGKQRSIEQFSRILKTAIHECRQISVAKCWPIPGPVRSFPVVLLSKKVFR